MFLKDVKKIRRLSSPFHSLRLISFLLFATTMLALFLSDLETHTASPLYEFGLMAEGFLNPQVLSLDTLLPALYTTLAFAFQGVMLAAVLGFLLSLLFRHFYIRVFAAFIRSIHELFWALLFIQITGLTPLTGFLAILIPFTGIFAKVFSEILDEVDKKPELSLNPQIKTFSLFLYTRVALAWPQMKAYLLYRLECGIRSSAILGFVGLPTLGFELESYFKQGFYAEAATLLYVFFILIASLKYLVKIPLLPVYTLIAFIYLPPVAQLSWPLISSFIGQEIIPISLQNGNFSEFLNWLSMLWQTQILDGLINTLVLSQLALALTGAISLLLFPFSSKLFAGKITRTFSQSGLIIMRSSPEYLLAFMGLLILGPSMLPAILALAVHNSAVIAHLLSVQSQTLRFREDVSQGINLYLFETLPRLYGSFLALLFYRWEVIVRETAILGMLGIPTLGFYIDSAFEEIRFDRAILLILITALLNILIDNIAVFLRKRMHFKHQPLSF